MSNFVYHEDVADAVNQVVELFDKGRIDGIAIMVKTTDDEIWSYFSNVNYAEKLGFAEIMKDDAKHLANKTSDED